MAGFRLAGSFGGIGRVLSNPDYRTYWSGQVFHVQGIWIHRVAAGWLIFHMTGSPVWLGAIGFALSAPMLVLGPIAGAVCDRVGHRWVALISVGGGFVLMALLAALTFADAVTPGILFAMVIFQAVFIAFEYPARQSLIPTLIRREDIAQAMALNWATFTVATFTGPTIAGALLTAGGPQLAFATVVVTYLWMAIVMLRIPGGARPSRQAFAFGGLLGEIVDGVRYTLAHRHIPVVIALQCGVTLLLRPYADLMPGFAVDVFATDAKGLAILLAAAGLGAVIVATIMTLRTREGRLAQVLVLGAIGAALALLGFVATDMFWVAAASLVFVGGLMAGVGIAASTLVQQFVAPDYRGRVISVTLALYIGGPAVGALGLGWLADVAGFRIAIAAAALVVLIAVGAIGRPLLRRLRGPGGLPTTP